MVALSPLPVSLVYLLFNVVNTPKYLSYKKFQRFFFVQDFKMSMAGTNMQQTTKKKMAFQWNYVCDSSGIYGAVECRVCRL